jgi:hypothetical protein
MAVEGKMTVAVDTQIEFAVGEKTAAWLVSLGWTPPVESDGVDDSVVEAVPLKPSAGVEAAKVALNSRETERAEAQAAYNNLRSDVQDSSDLDKLMAFLNVNMDRFLSPVVQIEIPGLSDAKPDA